MYDPKTARFLSEDTYTGDPNDPLSLNLYTYCANNPLIYWDPTGHYWTTNYDGSELRKVWKNNGEYVKKYDGSELRTVWVPSESAKLMDVDTSKDDFWTNKEFFNEGCTYEKPERLGLAWQYDKRKQTLAIQRLTDEANANGKGFNVRALQITDPNKMKALQYAMGLSPKGYDNANGDFVSRLETVQVLSNLERFSDPNIVTPDYMNGILKYYTERTSKFRLDRGAGLALDNFSEQFYSPALLGILPQASLGKSNGIRANGDYIDAEIATSNTYAQVNIDTGTAHAFISEGSTMRYHLKELVKGKQMVMTEAAIDEFLNAVNGAGGPLEQARAQKFLSRVTKTPNNPTPRFSSLKITGNIQANDKIIFGTGDNLGIQTITSDSKFVRGVAAQKVNFEYIDTTVAQKVANNVPYTPGGVKVYIHDPVPLKNK